MPLYGGYLRLCSSRREGDPFSQATLEPKRLKGWRPNVNGESSINFGNEEEPAPYNIPNSVCPSGNCNGVTGCLLNYTLQPANGSVLQMTLNLKYDKGEEVPDGRPAERGTEPFELLYEIVPLKLGDYPRCDIKNEGNEASGSILIPVACGLDEMELYKKGGSFQQCEACVVAVDESAGEEGCVCPDGYEEYDNLGQCIQSDSDGGSAAVRGPLWV
ncbi:hypothetical protein QOT17_007380 [Balamuthia mandrillaris]